MVKTFIKFKLILIIVINEIVDKLFQFEKLQLDKPLSEFQLPFSNNKFKLEFWSPFYYDSWGVVIRDSSGIIGFKEFNGIIDVKPSKSKFGFSPGFSRNFKGFDNYLSEYFYNLLEGETTNNALYVKEAFRDNYSGIGKTIISVSLEIMKRILKNAGKFKDNYSMFMTRECSTDIYQKYFGAKRSSNYDSRQDVVVFTNVICPNIDITKK